jgi:hypothetical protein
VNIATDGRTIVFRTDPGSKLAVIDRHPAVALEVDGLDFDTRRGWSVVVRGRANEMRDPEELRRVREHRFLPWTVGDKTHWIRIVPTVVSGRAIEDRAARR